MKTRNDESRLARELVAIRRQMMLASKSTPWLACRSSVALICSSGPLTPELLKLLYQRLRGGARVRQ